MSIPVWFRAVVSRCWWAGGVVAGGLMCAARLVAAPADYLVDVLDTKDNLPSSTVTAITQTPEGYLWIGTYNGLTRFDGVRFVTFDPSNTPELEHSRVQGLFLDVGGTLWINTYRGGLTSFRDGVFRRERPGQAGFDLHTTLAWSGSNKVVFAEQFGEVLVRTQTGTNVSWTVYPPPAGARPFYQCAAPDGTLWYVRREGTLMRFAGNQFQELPPEAGVGTNRAHVVAMDAQGRAWVGADNFLGRWDGRVFEPQLPADTGPAFNPTRVVPTRSGAVWVLANDRLRKWSDGQWTAEVKAWQGLLSWTGGRVTGVHEDANGGVWFNHYGNGVFHITPEGEFQRLTTQDGLPGDRVGAWFQSSDGGVWLGVDRGGLARLRERRFQLIDTAQGLTVRTVLSVCEDGSGDLWIGTGGGGLYRWSDEKLSSYALGPSVAANFVFSIYPQPGGGVWLSATETENLFRLRGNRLERAPWDPRGVKSILVDQTGRVWLGTKSGLAWWSEQGRRIFGANDGLSPLDGAGDSPVRALTQSPEGVVWCGSDDGALYRCETERLQAYRPRDAVGDKPIWSLLADREGAIWAGTFRGGLLRFQKGEFKRITAAQGLPEDTIVQILEDDQGRLWLGTHHGIYCVAKSALNDCANGKVRSVSCASYGGLPTLECSDGYQPSCWRGRDGRLWFATVRGVVSVNPRELKENSRPPPVVIEDFRVDGKTFKGAERRLVVPPGHRQFEFQFTALSFGAVDKTRFRYRLVGLDSEWVEAGPRRTAQYGNLPAREYSFRVIACNNEGIWNQTGATISFVIRPFFYETWWFRSLAGVSALVVVAWIVRKAATQKYRRKLARLEQQHAIERDRARIAKDIHDDIGAGLTQITLLGELARREPEQAAQHLDRISSSARKLTLAMDEIVWAVDPQHDTLNGLMDYISAYAEDFLRVAGIRCRMDLPGALPEVRVESEVRYNLFLALKETLNNIVKHAQATEVWLRLRVEARTLTLVIEDNGRGLSAAGAPAAGGDRIHSGSGLANLEQRLEAIGGNCAVSSRPGEGTRVEMTLYMNTTPSPVMAIGRHQPLG